MNERESLDRLRCHCVDAGSDVASHLRRPLPLPLPRNGKGDSEK